MGGMYTVGLAFELRVSLRNPASLATAVQRFTDLLPDGAETLDLGIPDSEGVARVSVRLPATAGPAHALHTVATALELTAAQDPKGLDVLGELRHASVDFEA